MRTKLYYAKSLLSKMTREAHPIEAAERRQYVAPGASPGISALSSVSTVGATDSVSYWLRPVGLAFAPLIGSFAPTGLDLKKQHVPRAYARGYILSPLRGSIRTRLCRVIQIRE